ATTTSLTSSANPAIVGSPVSFTATVASTVAGQPTPSGTIQFLIDGANYGSPVSLINGSASTGPITSLAIGSHTVTASYSGSASYTASTSAALTQAIKLSNDDFANRAPISGSSLSITGTNVGATKQSGEPIHAGNAGGASVWWTWT